MSALVIPREQAYREAREVFDRALMRLAEDYAAGRLRGEQLAGYERLRALDAARRSQAIAA